MTDASTPESAPLHPRLAAIAEIMNETRDELWTAAYAVPVAARDTQSAEGRWSATQVLDHLVQVEDQAGRLFSVTARQLRESGAQGETEEEAGSLIGDFARFDVGSRSHRISAPALVAPKGSHDFDSATEALKLTRARLSQAMNKASGLALGSVSAPHPVLGPLTMYEWLLLVALHERRHAAQLHEIAAFFIEQQQP